MSEFKFKIRNIKGYGDIPQEITLNLNPNRLNFVVAPNGSGKTSFTTAFNCLSNGKIDVPLEWKYKKQKNATSSLSIATNGVEWVANGRSNKISSEWNPVVINTRVHTDIMANAGERGAMVNEPITRVMSICAKESIPPKVIIPYDLAAIKGDFGIKRGALKDYSASINTVKFLIAIKESIPCLYQFNYYPVAKSRINQLVNKINAKNGNIRTLKSKMSDADFKTIEQYNNYKKFKVAFSPILGTNSHKLDYFLLFYQLFTIYTTHSTEIKNAVAWAEYEFIKQQISMDLECVKCPWKGASLKERDNKLFIDYPLVDEYSNGQRDIMTLYTQLLLFKQSLSDNKKYILILDEVFDYLDDANLLAAQYFVSSLLEKNNENSTLYIILFTHLDPDYYRTYVLKKYINVQYLITQKPIPNTLIKCFIGYRDWLKKKWNEGDLDKAQLYKNLSNYLFHYNPNDCNYREEIKNHQYIQHPVKETWGEKSVLYTYLIGEVNNYLSGENYDPYAVAFAIRLRVEKIAYNLITDEQIKKDFLDANQSYDKIEICTNHNIPIPIFYMMVIAIGNEADHLKEKNGEYQEKEMVYKLKNNIIKRIISNIFEYNDKAHPASLDSIYP